MVVVKLKLTEIIGFLNGYLSCTSWEEKEVVLIWIFFGIFAFGALIGVLFVALLSVAKDQEAASDWWNEPSARLETVKNSSRD
jgi:hypothetical protein